MLLEIHGTCPAFNYYCPATYSCDRFWNNVKPSCNYLCCTGGVWYRGTFIEGTPCLRQARIPKVGVCMRGLCISTSGGASPGIPPFYPSQPSLPSCNEIPRIDGYASSCRYSCSSGRNGEGNQHYPEDTPCLKIRPDGNKPAGVAGLCRSGECVEYFNLDDANVMEKAFPRTLLRCPEKVYLGRNAVQNCHHYCRLGNNWFSGSFMGNTTCQGDDPYRLGWCCNGFCHKEMWCGLTENSVD